METPWAESASYLPISIGGGSAMTLSGFAITSGQAGPPALDRVSDDLRWMGWPSRIHRQRGWWWAVADGDMVVACGWTRGGQRDVEAELGQAARGVAPLIAARKAG